MATAQDVFDRVLDRWSLQPEDLDVGPQVLGAGSFGEVRAGTLRDGNCRIPVAVKLLPMNGNSEETWNKIGAEAVLLAKVSERCKSTSRLYGICRKDDKFCLVMKKYVTSLERKINEYPDRKAPWKKVEQWALDICQAVAELHAQNVIFLDLKPSNVLLDEYGGAILADFGISEMVERTVAQHQTSTTVASTLAYMAPKTFNARVEERYCKVDVWSLGCLLLELHIGRASWQELDIADMVCEVPSLRGHPSIPLEMNWDLLDVLQQCLVYDPAKRASARTILEALKIAYYQAPDKLTNFQEKCHVCYRSGKLATCLQCMSKLSMQHDTTASSGSIGRIKSLEGEVEALTFQKDEAQSQLCALEEKVEKLKRVNEDEKKEKVVLERRLAQFERRNAQLLEQTSKLTKLVAGFDEQKQALEEAEAQLFAANGEVEKLKAESDNQKRQLDATARGAEQMASKNTVLESKVAHYETVNAQLLKQVTDLQQDKARLEHAEYEAASQKFIVQELVAREAALEGRMMQLESRNKDLSKQNSDLKEMVVGLRRGEVMAPERVEGWAFPAMPSIERSPPTNQATPSDQPSLGCYRRPESRFPNVPGDVSPHVPLYIPRNMRDIPCDVPPNVRGDVPRNVPLYVPRNMRDVPRELSYYNSGDQSHNFFMQLNGQWPERPPR